MSTRIIALISDTNDTGGKNSLGSYVRMCRGKTYIYHVCVEIKSKSRVTIAHDTSVDNLQSEIYCGLVV